MRWTCDDLEYFLRALGFGTSGVAETALSPIHRSRGESLLCCCFPSCTDTRQNIKQQQQLQEHRSVFLWPSIGFPETGSDIKDSIGKKQQEYTYKYPCKHWKPNSPFHHLNLNETLQMKKTKQSETLGAIRLTISDISTTLLFRGPGGGGEREIETPATPQTLTVYYNHCNHTLLYESRCENHWRMLLFIQRVATNVIELIKRDDSPPALGDVQSHTMSCEGSTSPGESPWTRPSLALPCRPWGLWKPAAHSRAQSHY